MSRYEEKCEFQIYEKRERLRECQIQTLKLLERAVNCGFVIKVKDLEFIVETPKNFIEVDQKEFVLDIMGDNTYNWDRIRLAQYVSYVEQMTGIEEERIREEAMSKLTEAEIAVLENFWKRSSDALTKDRP